MKMKCMIQYCKHNYLGDCLICNNDYTFKIMYDGSIGCDMYEGKSKEDKN